MSNMINDVKFQFCSLKASRVISLKKKEYFRRKSRNLAFNALPTGHEIQTQPTFTLSQSTMETPEQCVKVNQL